MASVMLVDDHRFLAEVLASRLEALGHKPLVVDLQEPVLDQLGPCESGGVVVLDLQLGDDKPRGEEYIQPLVERGCQVLVLSGVTDQHAFARCLELGASGVLETARKRIVPLRLGPMGMMKPTSPSPRRKRFARPAS